MRYAADGSPFLQQPISRRHCVAAKTKLRGQRPLTGQTIAGQEPAESNLLLNILRHLEKKEIAFCPVQAEAIRCECRRHRQRPAYQS
jgi:hypothetical protein